MSAAAALIAPGFLPTTVLAVSASAAEVSDPRITVETRPFTFEDVGFTPDCRPNAAFDRLLALLTPRPPSDDAESRVFDEPLYNAVSGDAAHVLRLDVDALWHGLQLLEVRFHHGIERGPANYTLVYGDDPEQVRAVWNARGWDLPAVGQTRDVAGLEGYASVGVEADGEVATVTCYRD